MIIGQAVYHAASLAGCRWTPVERMLVGSLYRQIYKSTCYCGALLKRDGTIIPPPPHGPDQYEGLE